MEEPVLAIPFNSGDQRGSDISTNKSNPEYDYEELPDSSMTANMCAGAFAGIMEHTLIYPIDVLKTRMQMITTNGLGKNGSSSLIKALTKISASEGALSLWSGVSSMILGAGPAHAVYFGVYEYSKNGLLEHYGFKNDKNHHPMITSVAGVAATVTSEAVLNPFDVVKQRMQLHNNNLNLWRTSLGIFRNEGIGAFYLSYPTTVAMNIPFHVLNFTVYESSLKILNPSSGYNPIVHCIAGGIAGAVSALATTPLDCIKTFLQTKGIAREERIRNVSSFKQAIKTMYEIEGLKGFTKGWKPRIVANIPSTAISWSAYEMAKFYLNNSNSK